MEDHVALSPESIYKLVAEVGFRRHFHLGGLQATDELLELCQLKKDQYVLDVGCASGKTACYVARRYGCRVMGVDILERMIDRANERSQREGVEEQVSFRVADAQHLPFEDDHFDVVIGEFITGLLDNKGKGTGEYLRVAKPGGYVGLNEATWIRTPPPPELARYLSGTFGVKEVLTANDWIRLLEGSGLKDLQVRTHKVNRLSRSWDDLGDVLRVWHRVLYLYIRDHTFRRFVRETLSVPRNLLEYFGYGMYVGRK